MDLKYKRPKKARRIRTKWGSNRGRLCCTKPHLFKGNRPHVVEYESTLERDLFYLLDQDPNCHDFQSQPFKFKWKNDKGKEYPFYPDIWTIFEDGTQVIIQVKPKDKLKELEKDPSWKKKCEIIEEYCRKRGWIFRIFTNEEIRRTRLRNVEFLRYDTQAPPSDELIVIVKEKLSSIFKKPQSLGKRKAAKELSKKMRIPLPKATVIIEYLMFRNFFHFDWDKPVAGSTQLSIRGEHGPAPKPVYKLTPTSGLPKWRPLIEVSNHTHLDNRDLESIPEEERETARKHFEYIEPLLEKRSREELKRKHVEKRAEEVGVSVATLYRYLERFEKDGMRGLFPRNRFMGNRAPQFPVRVEELIKHVIKEYYQKKNSWRSKKRCYELLRHHCEKEGLEPPCYSTFNSRINETPKVEVKGTQNAGVRHTISRSLMGGKPLVRRPLELVYLDHTLLDIVLIDPYYGRPIGRPWLTLAMDAYSRKVYGFYLSMDDVSSVSVGMALVMGILPKDDILDRHGGDVQSPWEIHGLLKMAKWDNERPFDCKPVEEFCYFYLINHEFSPVKRPDLNGIVERFFGTINRAIGEDGLPGYAPRKEERPDGYNPDKEASLTLADFESWLLSFFMVYHNRAHESLGMTPREKYIEGMEGREPSAPENPDRLWFDMLPFDKRTLGSRGISFNGLHYNCRRLKRLRNRSKDKVKVIFRYNPKDVRCIFWYDEQKEEYVRVDMTNAALAGLIPYGMLAGDEKLPPISITELKKISDWIKSKGGSLSPFDIADARENLRKETFKADKNNKRLLKRIAQEGHNIENSVFPYMKPEETEIIIEDDPEEEVMPAKAFRWSEKAGITADDELDDEVEPAGSIKWKKGQKEVEDES